MQHVCLSVCLLVLLECVFGKEWRGRVGHGEVELGATGTHEIGMVDKGLRGRDAIDKD